MESIERTRQATLMEPELTSVKSFPPGRPDRLARLGSSRYGYTFRRFLLASDVIALAIALGVTTGALLLSDGLRMSSPEILSRAAFVPAWLFIASALELYHLAERRIDQSLIDEVVPVFMATTVWIWLYELTAAMVLGERTELTELGTLWGVTIIAVLIMRAVARAIARGRAWFRRTVALVGSEQDTRQVLARIARHPEWGLDPVAAIRVGIDGHGRIDHLDGDKVRYQEPFQDARDTEVNTKHLAAVIAELGVDRAIVAGGSGSWAERTELTRALTGRQTAVDYVASELESVYSSTTLHFLEGLPILTIQPTHLWRGSAAFKRGVDLAVASIGLLVLAPALLYAAVRIKLDSPGPVLFHQTRVGKDGRVFKMLKLRTMVDGADQLREDVRGLSMHDGTGMLKVSADPRVTRFGAKLRRWSLDEVPQLWDVIRGDMSLVGPRPLPEDEAALVQGCFVERIRVRPGITGPWQTQGRSDIPFEDMIKLDYMYVANRTMREDIRLLARTLGAVTRGRGAY